MDLSHEFLTMDEAAALLRVDRASLDAEIRRTLPRWARPIGRHVRISRAALLRWFDAP